MKTFAATLLLIALTIVTFAQQQSTPKKEFDLLLSAGAVTLKPGTSAEITLTVMPSKAYQKSKATFSIASAVPNGVQVSFSQASADSHEAKVIISVDAGTQPGTHILILSATLQNKKKGATLKLLVDPENQGTAASKLN